MSTDADSMRLRDLLARFGLPTAIPAGTDPSAILAAMRLDKKNASGRLRLILWRGVGRAEIADNLDEAAIRGVLAA